MPAIALDAFDRAILDVLQRDNLTPQRLIAERVHLSAPAVQRRIKRLQELGVITANIAVVDPVRTGRPLTVLINVQLANERPDLSLAFRARVAREAAVQQCYYVTGEADYSLIVTAADWEEYQALAARLFSGDDNIRRYTTSIALERIKTGLQLPLAEHMHDNETN
jgi:DNA-binding Lrp family transcriptional regulator